MTATELEPGFKAKAENDTGYFARNVLGMTESRHWKTGEMIPGGVLDTGPHLEMTTFIDDESQKMKLLEAPRGSYKTSILQAFVMRMVLRDPNLRVCYGMATYKEALKTLDFIREHMEQNPIIEKYWGEQRGKHWNREAFTIASRTRVLKEPTFSAFAPDKNVTGMHYDIIIPDDLVNKDNVRTKEGIEKTLLCWNGLFYLLDPGGWLLPTGTRYSDSDLWGHIESNLGNDFDTKKFDCGLTWIDNEGKMDLVGEPNFGHLTKDFLRAQFRRLNYDMGEFSSQYMNECLSASMQLFRREQFLTCHWEDWMKDLSVYMLVDTATDPKDANCYSVGWVVGLDSRGDAYVLDAYCGLMDPAETTKNIIGLFQKWQSKNPIRKLVMEKVTANDVFKPLIEMQAAAIHMRIKIETVVRGTGDRKRARIPRLQGRFQEGTIHWVDTIPPTYMEAGEHKRFFTPEGFGDGEHKLPKGEAVDHFIRYPTYGRDDLADALADLDAIDNKGFRICPFGSRRPEEKRKARRRRAGTVIPMPMKINGRVQMVDVLTQQPHTGESESFLDSYERKRRRL